MEPGSRGKIEIFAPFSSALDLTKLILFQPFDLAKWMVIGFAAFLAHLGGGGGNFSYNRRFSSGDWKARWHTASGGVFDQTYHMPGWFWPVVVIIGLMVVTLVILCMWLGARGRFILTDCIVHNRAAIVQPWKELRVQGNSLFLFTLATGFALLVVAGGMSAPLWLPYLFGSGFPDRTVVVLALCLLAVVLITASIVVRITTLFLAANMYRRRCRATEALRPALSAMSAHLGPIILFVLFFVVLIIALAVIQCLAVCLTCCIAAIPYVGTVILLPLHVFLASYALLFVRQFGNDFDVWATLVTPEPPPPSPSPEALPA